MDINSIPEAFQSRIRLAVISSLIMGDSTFSQIKEITQTSDGNLSIHLRKLEEAGYISSKKEFIGKKPRSTYTLTNNGRKEFEDYVKLLGQILQQNDSK